MSALASIPYPGAGDPQACADWCASQLVALSAGAGAEVSSMSVVQAWAMQHQWVTDGGAMASYPLPLASGPATALGLQGDPTAAAPLLADVPSVMWMNPDPSPPPPLPPVATAPLPVATAPLPVATAPLPVPSPPLIVPPAR